MMSTPIIHCFFFFIITSPFAVGANKVEDYPPTSSLERQSLSKEQRKAIINALCHLAVPASIERVADNNLGNIPASSLNKSYQNLGLDATPKKFREKLKKYLNSGKNTELNQIEFAQFLMSNYGINFVELTNVANHFAEKIKYCDLNSKKASQEEKQEFKKASQKAINQTISFSDFSSPRYKFTSIELGDDKSKEQILKQFEKNFSSLILNVNLLNKTLKTIKSDKDAKKSLKHLRLIVNNSTHYLIQIGYAKVAYNALESEIKAIAFHQLEKYTDSLKELSNVASQLEKQKYFNNQKLKNIIQISIHRQFGTNQNTNKEETKKKELENAVAGDAKAQYDLGISLLQGAGAEGNVNEIKKGLFWLEKAATQNHPLAQNILAYHYLEGLGIERDEIKAFTLFSKAAELGLAEAQANLALAYRDGRGVMHDTQKSLMWLKKAAQGNYTPAQRNLADNYFKGNGVPQNIEKGFYWLQKAADLGDAIAQFHTGRFYLQGQIKEDPVKGVFYLQKAAAQNYPDAQNILAFCYKNGRGIKKDMNKAIELWKKAAKQGNAQAQEQLQSLNTPI